MILKKTLGYFSLIISAVAVYLFFSIEPSVDDSRESFKEGSELRKVSAGVSSENQPADDLLASPDHEPERLEAEKKQRSVTKILSPDELYELQTESTSMIADELPATVPELVAVTDELRVLEFSSDMGLGLAAESQDSFIGDPLPDDPNQPYADDSLAAELPASEDFEPALSYELSEAEREFDASKILPVGESRASVQYQDILYDDPETLEVSDPLGSTTEPASDVSTDADFE